MKLTLSSTEQMVGNSFFADQKEKPGLRSRRTTYEPHNRRNILCLFPKYSRSFGTMSHAYSLMRGVKAFMPPQGILVVAAYLPECWEVRFVDENIKPAQHSDYQWADVVITSGMHIQRHQLNQINATAHQYEKITVLGGPSVSACPEHYPDFDLLHIGELGDATDRLIAHLDCANAPPSQQIQFETRQRLPLNEFPIPAYHLLSLKQYFIASMQFSSGCPYRCEFCDIPELFGRKPRFKSPQQVITELDAILASHNPGIVYFVDDNFTGNRHAVMELLPHLIQWQKNNGYPIRFGCETTLNLAQSPKLMEMMREAYFCQVFCGIETPDADALSQIAKKQNIRIPIHEAIKILNSYGLEVVAGIIMGLDTDTPETCDQILDFIQTSHIPMLTINLLYALPKSPLWRRLEQEGRLNFEENRESNVEFLMPYEDVLQMWERCITAAYDPEFLFERFNYQCEHTFSKRIKLPLSSARVNMKNALRGLTTLMNLFWHAGVTGSYRHAFWKMAKPRIKKGEVEHLLNTGLLAHHLIEYTRDCSSGMEFASFYSQ